MARDITITMSEDYSPGELIDMVDISDVVEHFGEDAFLEHIGEAAAIEYFGLNEIIEDGEKYRDL